MASDNNSLPPHGDSQPYSWMRHVTWNTAPLDQLPHAPGPVIYEGFVPQQQRQQLNHAATHINSQSYGTVQSQYPPLHNDSNETQFIGGPVQQRFMPSTIPSPQAFQFARDTGSLNTSAQAEQAIYNSTGSNEVSLDDDEQTGLSDTDVDNSYTSNQGQGPVRGRGRGRGRPRGRGIGRGSQAKRRQKERGGWNRGTKTGLRAVLDPGDEFNALHKAATEAFIDQLDYDKALELILKAISINPEIYSAHVLLSEVYFARDDDERGVAALFSGAHASPNDPVVWHQLADVCLQRSTMDRFTMLKQAAYCFQRLLQIDKEDHDARFQKAAISRELGHHAKAFKDLDYLLQKMPHNSSILRQVAEVCLDINDVGRAIGLYDDALEYQRLTGGSDEEGFSWADLIVYVDLVARPNGIPKAIQVLKNIARWLLGREDEVYWEAYIADDREWDAENEPRRVRVPQFQPELHANDKYGIGMPLEIRVKLGDFRLKTGDRQEAIGHYEWLAPDQREEDAPVYQYSDLFLQVADALREVKEFEQALRYYEALFCIDACDDVEFWLGFGACSYICEKREQALHCYEKAKDIDPTSGEARTQLSKLYAHKGEREKALVLARSALTIYESQLPQGDRRKYERKDLREAREAAQNAYKEAYKIPKPLDGRDDMPKPHFSRRARERARRRAREAARRPAIVEEEQNQDQAHAMPEAQQIREQSKTPPGRQEGLNTREEALKQTQRKKRSRKERTAQDRHDSVQQLYSTLSGVTQSMRDGDDVARNIWMDCAEVLVDEFRKEKVFYPAERYIKFQGYDRLFKKTGQAATTEGQEPAQADVPIPSVESTVPNEFCGIVFTNWLDLFLEYAMLLANLQEDTTDCYTVLQAAFDCNVWWHDQEAVFQIHACWLACAIALRDEITLFNTVIRWFMREYAFCTDTYRLFGAMNYYFPYPSDKGGKMAQMDTANFRSGPNQKYVFRQIMTLDSQLPESYGSDQPDGSVPDFMRRSHGKTFYVSDRMQREAEEEQSQSQLDPADSDGDQSPISTPLAFGDRQIVHRVYQAKELDVVLLVLYGQILYAGGSFPNALSYFFRAYNLDPKNPVLLLSIALCYIHQMMKRQNENRHMYLLQGWSFFEEYADARMEMAQQQENEGRTGLMMTVKREIEYNRARCWQMLGMNDLAIRSYGKMIDMRDVKTEDEMDVDDGPEHKEFLSKEAAYAMVNMYAVSGDMDKAREITEQYLVVE